MNGANYRTLAVAAGILALSFGSAAALRATAPGVVAEHPWSQQFFVKTTMALLSVAAIRAFASGGLCAAGFRRPSTKVRWLVIWVPSILLGMTGTLLVLAGGSRGMQSVFAGYGFAGIVFWIWFYSSITEEIFTRGWFQTELQQHSGPAVIASALLFGAMHLSLFRRIDTWAVIVIVTCVTALGYLAATLRRRYESLIPSIAAHVLFNIGGFLGGVAYVIGYRITTGRLPAP